MAQKTSRCPFCSGVLREVPVDIEKTNEMKDVIVTAVPAWECQKCKEIFLAYRHLRLVDRTVLFVLRESGELDRKGSYYHVFSFDELERVAEERGVL